MGADPDEGAGPSLTVESQYRERLYRILSDPESSPETLLRQLLDLGCERLGVENGHVVEVDPTDDRHEVVVAAGSNLVRAGAVSDLGRTFCRETITDDRILAFSNATDAGWGDDPAYREWELGCYIGSRVSVREDLYGTVCFVNRTSREASFTEAERTFVDLVSRSVSQVLERRRHDETLRETQDLFELLVEEVADYAIFLLDPAGQVATWNSGARLLKGYDESEIVGEHFSTFYPEEARQAGRPAKLLERARNDGRIEDEGWRVREDGSQFWALVTITALYDDDGNLRGFGKVTRDLTERRQSQRRLATEKAFTERALNALGDLFFVIDTDGSLERINERVSDVTGYSEAELLSIDPTTLFVPEDRERVEAAIAEALTTGEAVVEATLVTRDDRRRQYEFHGRRIEDDDSVTGIVGIGRDITDRKLYRERLEVTQRVLRHNLRNELNVLRGSAESLAETASESQRPAVERILDTTDDLVELTEKSRLMAEMEALSGDEPSIDLEEQLRRLLAEFRARYPDADVEERLPETLDVSVGSPDRFDVAVRNAVENAIEHNPAASPWVAVEATLGDGAVEVAVVDDGPVIPEAERQVVQEGGEGPLRHGSGLGLWLMHWCVATVGGEVTFEERAAGGNRITLAFPVSGT